MKEGMVRDDHMRGGGGGEWLGMARGLNESKLEEQTIGTQSHVYYFSCV